MILLAKRIITCLDVKEGRTVKGVHFNDLKDAGDIVELAKKYSVAGADELVFLDITASNDNRSTRLSWVERVATAVDVPFTVGGGITREADVEALLKKGADKISVNSAALSEPDLIDRLAYHFGKQCIVVAIDARYEKEEWCVYSKGGRLRTERELYTWALEVGERGAGEIMIQPEYRAEHPAAYPRQYPADADKHSLKKSDYRRRRFFLFFRKGGGFFVF